MGNLSRQSRYRLAVDAAETGNVQEIASAAGVSRGTVDRWIREFKIPRKNGDALRQNIAETDKTMLAQAVESAGMSATDHNAAAVYEGAQEWASAVIDLFEEMHANTEQAEFDREQFLKEQGMYEAVRQLGDGDPEESELLQAEVFAWADSAESMVHDLYGMDEFPEAFGNYSGTQETWEEQVRNAAVTELTHYRWEAIKDDD